MENEIEKLKKENEKLRGELDKHRMRDSQRNKRRFWVLKKTGTLFIGKGLKKSILAVFHELDKDKSVSKDTLADLSANLIRRFLRVGIVAFLIAILPYYLTYFQNELIKKQNSIIEVQNRRIEQQTHLTEAARRSTQMFIMGEVLQDINKELAEIPENGKRVLSKTLSGRIQALASAMKPYRYLEGDSLIRKPLSPERGQLLIALVAADFDTTFFYSNILKKCNFNYADLRNENLSNAYLKEANLVNANLSNANLYEVNLYEAYLSGANLSNTNLRLSELQYVDLIGADLRDADLELANLEGADLDDVLAFRADMGSANLYNTSFLDADLSYADLGGTELIYADFDGANLKGVNLESADFRRVDFRNIRSMDSVRVHTFDWFEYINGLEVQGIEQIINNYRIDSIPGPNYHLYKKMSPILVRKSSE